MTQINQNTITLTDKQLLIIQKALDRCNDNKIDINSYHLSNEIDEIIRKNKQMDIDLEYNYNKWMDSVCRCGECTSTKELPPITDEELPPITDEEIKNLPHPPKELLEDEEIKNLLLWGYKELVNKATDEIINCYYSWNENWDETGANPYLDGDFDSFKYDIELHDDYDKTVLDEARRRASKFFNNLYEVSTANINSIKKEMNTKKTFKKQNEKMQKYITKYLDEYQEHNMIYRKNTKLQFLAGWDSFACDYDTKEEYRTFLKNEIIEKLYESL